MIDGCNVLTPMEELVYRRICDLIYATGNRLEDDDRKLSWQTKGGRRWRQIRTRLVELGKIATRDGCIVNKRCDDEIAKILRHVDHQSRAGTASAEKRRPAQDTKSGLHNDELSGQHFAPETCIVADDNPLEINDTTTTGTATQIQPTLKPLNQEERTLSSDEERDARAQARGDPVTAEVLPFTAPAEVSSAEQMTSVWNETCGSFSRAIKPTAGREKILNARFRGEFNRSVEQWRHYCERVARSPYLSGRVKEWSADLGWVIQPANMTKILEGRYDERPNHQNGIDRFGQGSGHTSSPLLTVLSNRLAARGVD